MLTRFSHPDGGTYVIVDDHAVSMKMDDGRWEPAVLYRRVIYDPVMRRWAYEGKNHFCTSKARWAERFTPESDD